MAERAGSSPTPVSRYTMIQNERESLDHESKLVDILTIIADFLERSTSLHETVDALRGEVYRKGLLPPSIGWNGQVHPGRLPDFRSLRTIPRNHLVHSLSLVQPLSHDTVSPSNQSLLLTTLKALTESEQNALKRDQLDKIANTGTRARELIELRMQRRQLQREMDSEKGRSSGSLSSTLVTVTARIKRLSEGLVMAPRLRRELGNNTIDALLSPDIRRRQRDTSIQRLSVSRFQILKKVTGHRAPAYCASSAHAKWIFTAADDCVVKLWNGQNARLHACFRGHKNVITDIACTNDLIASASEDNTVRIWETSTARPFAVLSQHRQPVQRIQFSERESVLFTSAEDGACCVWNMDSLVAQARDRDLTSEAWISRERERRRHAALNSNANQPGAFLSEQQQELQLLFDCPRNPIAFEPPLVFPHCDTSGKIVKIVCMAVHPSGKFVATGSEDTLGRVWSVDEITSKPSPPEAPTLPGLINGEYIDGKDRLLCMLSGHTVGFVHHIEWSNAGDRILTFSDKDGTARIWFWPLGDFASKPQHIALKAISSTSQSSKALPRSAKVVPMIDGAGFTCDDTLVVTTQSIKPTNYKDEEPGFWDSRVCIWDSRSGSLLRFMRGHRQQGHVVRVHPFFNWLAATCGADGMIIFWDIKKGEEINRIEAISTEGFPSILDARWSVKSDHPAHFVATDSMGRLLIIGTGDSTPFSAAPCEQFFASERDPFVLDPRCWEPLDATLQVPLHLLPPSPLVDVFEERYPHQPPFIPRGEGSFLSPPRIFTESNWKQRIQQAAEKQRLVTLKEEAVMQEKHIKELITKQDAAIRREIERDLAGSQQGPPVASGVPSSSSKPRIPKQQKSAPMLAYERAALENASSSESEEDEEEQDPGDGRIRRAAARRANAQIHRHVRHFLDDPSRIEESNDPTFNEGSRRRSSRLRHDDDEEDELSESDSDDEDESVDFNELRDLDVGEVLPRQSRYQTRRRRQNYTALNDAREEELNGTHDADSDSSGEDEVRSRRRQRPAPRSLPPTTAPAVAFSDEWLTHPSETFSFIPQCGDTVVYFPQGHAEYLRHFPSTESPPWQSWNVKDWPFVVCQVLNVEHVFPPNDEPRQILCKVDLKVVGVKATGASSGNQVFAPYQGSLELRFSVLYHSFESEFLVLLERFKVGLVTNFKVGARIHCYIRNEESPSEPTSMTAIIKEITVRDQEEWPDSPWEALVCVSEHDGDQTTFCISPWDAQLESEGIPLWRTVSSETRKLWERRVQGESLMMWIANQIDLCPLWATFYRIRRHPNLPCFMTIRLVSERLRNGHFYRQFEAIEADVRELTYCATFGKPEQSPWHHKAARFLTELQDILNFARSGESSEAISATLPVSISGRLLKSCVFDCLLEVAMADKEGFFAEPVDTSQVTDYLEIISNPMDFSTLRNYVDSTDFCDESERLSLSKARRLLRSVISGIRQISINAMTYNVEGSIIFRRAKEVSKKLSEVFSNVDLDSLANGASDEAALVDRPSRIRTRSRRAQATSQQPAVTETSRGRRLRVTSYREMADESADSLLEDEDEEDIYHSSGDSEDNIRPRHSTRASSRRMERARPATRYALRSSQSSEEAPHQPSEATLVRLRLPRQQSSSQPRHSLTASEGSSYRGSFRRKRSRYSFAESAEDTEESERLGTFHSGGRADRASRRQAVAHPAAVAEQPQRPRRAAAASVRYDMLDAELEEPVRQRPAPTYHSTSTEFSVIDQARSTRRGRSTAADMQASSRRTRRAKRITFHFGESDDDDEGDAIDEDAAISDDDDGSSHPDGGRPRRRIPRRRFPRD